MARVFTNKAVLWSLALALLVAGIVGVAELFAGTAVAQDDDGRAVVQVDCSRGQSLNQALASRARTLVVEFTGTCNGEIDVARSDVTLRGADASATVVGGPVSVQGQLRVTLAGFTVRDAPPGDIDLDVGKCFDINSSHAVVLQGVNAVNCGNFGIELTGSTGSLRDTTVTGAGNVGLALAENSAFELIGVKVTQGAGVGIAVSELGTLDLEHGANLEVTDNQGPGLQVQLKGHATFHGESHVIADRNGIGINVVNVGSVDYGDATIEVANNRAIGLQVGELADWTPIAGIVPTLTIVNNGGPGIVVQRSAFLRLRANTTISGNAGPGLVVDGASVAVQGTTIQGNNGNQGDVLLSFGSGATFDGGDTFGTPISCDGTARARGQFQCSPTH